MKLVGDEVVFHASNVARQGKTIKNSYLLFIEEE
jgi:hypothetical protein